jgi:acetylxylan esterase
MQLYQLLSVSSFTEYISDRTTISVVLFREVEERQSCPNIHVFGARETTAAPGYGTAGVVVDLVLNAHPGATSEAIVYPACGGQSSCGDVSYASSVLQGVAAVASAVNSFNSRCPSTQLVLVGYSQVGNLILEFQCLREG